MKIDRKLNIVLELELEDGRPAHVHSVPVDDRVCEAHYMLISTAMTQLYRKLGANPAAVSRICYFKLRDLIAEDPDFKGAEQSFLQEIWRLTNVSIPGERGWEMVPFYECLQDGNPYLSRRDVTEVQNYICFFTAASWLHPRHEREGLYEYLIQSGAQITSSSFTEVTSSLPIWKPDESIGVKAEVLSPPS
jgi:hypothetical protein